jgi:hypothetical protein
MDETKVLYPAREEKRESVVGEDEKKVVRHSRERSSVSPYPWVDHYKVDGSFRTPFENIQEMWKDIGRRIWGNFMGDIQKESFRKVRPENRLDAGHVIVLETEIRGEGDKGFHRCPRGIHTGAVRARRKARAKIVQKILRSGVIQNAMKPAKRATLGDSDRRASPRCPLRGRKEVRSSDPGADLFGQNEGVFPL